MLLGGCVHILPLLATGVADTLTSADRIAGGLDKSPIAYVAALSLLVNLGLFAMLMRVQALRVAELKYWAERSEFLGGILEKTNQAILLLDRVAARRKPSNALGAEPVSGLHQVVKP